MPGILDSLRQNAALLSAIGAALGFFLGNLVKFGFGRRAEIRRDKEVRLGAAINFLGRVRGLMTQYSMLAYVVAHQKDEDYADDLFRRGLDAWTSLRNEQPALHTSPVLRYEIAEMLRSLSKWVDKIDDWYLQIKGPKRKGQRLIYYDSLESQWEALVKEVDRLEERCYANLAPEQTRQERKSSA